MSDTTAISVEGLSFSYDGPPVLRDATFSVARGEFVYVVGPNGGGKTTLLKIMLGLLRAGQGSIRIFGRRPAEVRQRIGYVPQHAVLDLAFPISVRGVVLMGLLGRAWQFGPFRRRDRAKAIEALEQVGLREQADRPFSRLSGGQRQRVLLARALVGDAELLLLDEPTAHVDVVVEKELFELLGRLNGRRTVVMVTHDMGFVAPHVSSVVCVNRHVIVHPTSKISGELIAEMYGADARLIRHDVGDGHHHHGDDCG